MKKYIFSAVSIMGLALVIGGFAFAHEMSAQGGTEETGGSAVNLDDHTAREEAEGKIIWEKLQAQEEKCANLSEGDFAALGEYFMGLMSGATHPAMNAMMTRMMGEEGEEQMHVVMGKRLSGCDSAAAYPRSFPSNFMSSPMMGNWGPNVMWGGFGSWLFPLTWIVWLLVGVLAAIWLWKQIQKK